jgi:hypothetical protein
LPQRLPSIQTRWGKADLVHDLDDRVLLQLPVRESVDVERVKVQALYSDAFNITSFSSRSDIGIAEAAGLDSIAVVELRSPAARVVCFQLFGICCMWFKR